MDKVSERVFELIDKLGLSEYRFSQIYDFPMSTLNDWKNNNTVPTREKIKDFCKCVGISVKDFYTKGLFFDSWDLEEEDPEKEDAFVTLKMLSKEVVMENKEKQGISYLRFLLTDKKAG